MKIAEKIQARLMAVSTYETPWGLRRDKAIATILNAVVKGELK